MTLGDNDENNSDDDDDDDDDEADDGGGDSVKYIRNWHANKANNKTGSWAAGLVATAAISTTAPTALLHTDSEKLNSTLPYKKLNSTLQYVPENTPHMDAMGKRPEYYPQVP